MTRIGDRNRLGLEIQPVVPWWSSHYAPERTAWASLSIWIRGVNLCEHVSRGSSGAQSAVYVPLVPIADWLIHVIPALRYEERPALFRSVRGPHRLIESWGTTPPPFVDSDDWIDEREAWWSRHFLAAGADGAYLPNLAFVREDEQLTMTWRPPRFVAHDAPKFLEAEGEAAVDWRSGERVLREFVALVAEQARHAALAGEIPWAIQGDPLEDVAFERRLGFFTGRSTEELRGIFGVPDRLALKRALGLGDAEEDPAASPVTQVLRDLPPQPAQDALRSLLDPLAHSSGRHVGAWESMRDSALDAASAGTSPEEAGMFAARSARARLGLDGQPLGDERRLLDELHVALDSSPQNIGGVRMIVGARVGGGARAIVLDSARTKTRWGRRFESARALGHILLDPVRGDALGAASSDYAQETRRRRSGAFAAELLLPSTVLATIGGGRLDGAADPRAFAELCARFGVGARTAAMQLWNQGWLSSRAVRDELIDSFAGKDID